LWTSCVGRGLISTLSHMNGYWPAFRASIGNNYEMVDMPININCQFLNNLRIHQNDPTVSFKCDFTENY
jgi:hypothetical protein